MRCPQTVPPARPLGYHRLSRYYVVSRCIHQSSCSPWFIPKLFTCDNLTGLVATIHRGHTVSNSYVVLPPLVPVRILTLYPRPQWRLDTNHHQYADLRTRMLPTTVSMHSSPPLSTPFGMMDVLRRPVRITTNARTGRASCTISSQPIYSGH